MTEPAFIVHRDGVAWSVSAPDPVIAVARAQEGASWTEKEAGSCFLVNCFPERLGEGAPRSVPGSVASAWVLDGETCLALWCLGERWSEWRVTVCERPTFDDAVRLLEQGLAQVKACRTESPKRVAVSCFKSGKRAGQLRFTRAHDAAFRAEVESAVECNARLAWRREWSLDLVEASACTVAKLVTVAEGLPIDAARRLGVLETRAEKLATLAASGVPEVVAWARDQAKTWDRLVNEASSIVAVGFAPGTRAHLTRDPHAGPDEDSPAEGPCTIEGAWSELHSETHHYRLVEDSNGRQWDVPTTRLSLLP